MFKVLALATTTLREMLRERIFFIVVFMAVGLLALSLLLGALTIAEQRRIMADFGFLAIQISVLGVSLFSGSYLIAKEVEKQTCLLILSRPLSRAQFLLGKILGVLALNSILLIALALLLWALLGLWSEPRQWGSFVAINLSLWFESAVVLAAVILFSLLIRPVLALTAGVTFFLLGHWLNDLSFFAEKSKEALFINMVKVFNTIVPNFYRANWKSAYYLENGLPASSVLWMLMHMTGWFLLLVLMAQFLFRRKDIV